MQTEKQVTIKLFFNRKENMAYIQIGDHSLYKIKSTIAARISEKEGIDITHVEGVKEMQIITNQ